MNPHREEAVFTARLQPFQGDCKMWIQTAVHLFLIWLSGLLASWFKKQGEGFWHKFQAASIRA